MWIYVMGLVYTFLNGALASEYKMEDFCNYNELSFLWQGIYQTRLVLNDDFLYNKIGYCRTTIEARHTTFTKFMFFFQNIDLDCDGGHLEFYINRTSDTRVTGLEYDVCGQDKPEGMFIVNSKYMRIKYVPKRSHYIANIFEIILTTYGEGECPSFGHECDNGRCIHDNIACNGYDSCGDNSGCKLDTTSTGSIVGIVIGSISALGLIIGIVVCYVWSSRRRKGAPAREENTATTTRTQAATYTRHPMASQPLYTTSQGSPYPTSMSTYPLIAPTNLANSNQTYPVSAPTNAANPQSTEPTYVANLQPYQITAPTNVPNQQPYPITAPTNVANQKPSYPVTVPTNIEDPNTYQQDNFRPIYSPNQGMNIQYNHGPHISHPQTNRQEDPPPSYSEVIGNRDKRQSNTNP